MDLIDRTAALDAIYARHIHGKNLKKMCEKLGKTDAYSDGILEAVRAVEDQPTIESVPVVHGTWMTYKYDEKKHKSVVVPWDEKDIPFHIFCSECRTPALLNGHEEDVASNYCHKCGALMDGKVKEDDNGLD